MVLAADRVKMLLAYKPKYADEVSDNVVDDESVICGLSITI